MAGDIPREKIQEIVDRVDIERVIGRHLTLKKQGARLVGLCPFHKEKSPSFSVDPRKKLYHCFGCQVGGDVIDFVKRIEHVEFPDAVRILARETGVELPEVEVSPEERRLRQERERMFRVNELARDFYVRALWDELPALAYLREARNLDDATIRAWSLGWAPAGWSALSEYLAVKQVPDELLVRLGLVGRRREGNGVYDKLRGRVVFPIVVPGGEIAGFGARRADWIELGDAERGPKYLNSSESPVYEKSQIFFGLDKARDSIRRTKRAVLVEGYLDVIALHQAGMDLAIATCGTALSGRHAGLLSRMVEEVVTLYDGDQAGLDATRRASEILLQAGVSVRVATVPDGEDPDTWVQKIGGDALKAALDRAPSAIDAAVERARVRYVGAGVAGTVKVVEEIRPLLMAVRDPLQRSVYAEGAAKLLGLDPHTLTGHLPGARAPRPQRAAPSAGGHTPGPDDTFPPRRADDGGWSPSGPRGFGDKGSKFGGKFGEKGTFGDRGKFGDKGRPWGDRANRGPLVLDAPIYGAEEQRRDASGGPMPSKVEAALLRHMVETPEVTVQKMETRDAFSALFHPAVRVALDAGRRAVAMRIGYDAHQALEIVREEADAGDEILRFLRENLINPAPNDDPLDECLENLLRKDKPRRLRVLREQLARTTDPEERSRLEVHLAELLAPPRR